jgi:YggT family protein
VSRSGEAGLLVRRRNCTRQAAFTLWMREMTGNFLVDLIVFISYLLTLYVYILIAAVILSWLVVFNIVNPRNQFVSIVGEFLYRITEPVLRPIRNMLPNLGGIDISPVILILLIFLIERVIIYYIYPYTI